MNVIGSLTLQDKIFLTVFIFCITGFPVLLCGQLPLQLFYVSGGKNCLNQIESLQILISFLIWLIYVKLHILLHLILLINLLHVHHQLR